MIAIREPPRIQSIEFGWFVLKNCHPANAATNRLRMAPTSAPSVTHSPTENPEIITRVQVLQLFQSLFESSVIDKIVKLNEIAMGANPQHAYEKTLLLSIADMPVSNPTIG
jgi:hypothetical protein